jgi:hypothetical protein
MMRIQTYATKATAASQTVAINQHWLATAKPAATRGANAPPDATARLVLLQRFVGGEWGFEVDAWTRALHGQTVGTPPVLILIATERDAPEEAYVHPVCGAGTRSVTEVDVTGSDVVAI